MTDAKLQDIFHHLTPEQQKTILGILEDAVNYHYHSHNKIQKDGIGYEPEDRRDHSTIYKKLDQVIDNLKAHL